MKRTQDIDIEDVRLVSQEEETSGIDNTNSQGEDSDKEKISVFRLLLATICFSGIQFGWALQIALLTPFTLELGMPKEWVTIVWLCGPIAGLLVQPTAGVFSDRCGSPWGRRRPFILSGAIFICLSLLIIPNSLDIGYYGFGDSLVPGNKPVATVLAIAGFWILDFSNNLIQGPCRALVADVAPASQQALGNASLSLWLAVGNITGYLAGFVDWSRIIKPFTASCQSGCNNLRICSIISIVFLIITTLITLIFANETPLRSKRRKEKRSGTLIQGVRSIPDSPKDFAAKNSMDIDIGDGHDDAGSNDALEKKIVEQSQEVEIEARREVEEKKPKKQNAIIHLLKLIIFMPDAMRRICTVQFFLWFAWFTFLIYISNWMAEYIFHGDPTAPSGTIEHDRFEEGVRWGSIGLSGFALVSLLTSPFVPRMVEVLGSKIVWFMGNLSFSICLASTFFVRNAYVGIGVISAIGFPWTVTMTVPFALIAQLSPQDEKGVYMGILNISVVVPQLCMAFLGPLIVMLSNFINFNAPALTLLFGSASALIATLLVVIVKVKKIEDDQKKSSNVNHLLGDGIVEVSTIPNHQNESIGYQSVGVTTPHSPTIDD